MPDKKKEYLNRLVVTAYTLFLFSTLLIAFAYKSLPLSIGAILETTGYIWIAVLGRLFFKERLNKRKCTGLLIIILGIIIFAVIFFCLFAGVYYSAVKECKK